MQGIAEPRGGHSDPQRHNDGDTKSIFTSWTRDRTVAERRAQESGIILEEEFPIPSNRFITYPYYDDSFCEEEVLVIGTVTDAKVIKL